MTLYDKILEIHRTIPYNNILDIIDLSVILLGVPQMKFTPMRRIVIFFIVVCIITVNLPIFAFATEQSIYINSNEHVISGESENLFAIGESNETVMLGTGDLYAATSSGIKKVGEEHANTAPSTGETPTPSEEVTISPVPNATPEPEFKDVPAAFQTIKVGLNYGDTAISEAVLSNEVGNGFLFGYYDSDRQFHEIGRTDATNITIIPDWNWTTSANVTVGCYHILKPGSFQTFDEAKTEADRIGGFPAYYSGSYFVMYGNYWYPEDGEAAKANAGITGEVRTQSSHCIVVTETGTNRILFEFDCGSANFLAIRPASDHQKAITVFNGLRYYGDFQFARLTGKEHITVVNYVEIEDYTKGVVPYEMYATWPIEALKAQALCARNYAVTNFNRYRAQGFDVSNDTYSQVYKGIGDATEITNAAVDATAGKFIRYEGKICQTFFFSSDGGATESSEYVWGNKIPYLIGVADPYENDVETYSKNWTYTVSPADAQTMVNARCGTNLDLIKEIDCSYTALGNMKSMTFVDINHKTHTVSGNRCNYVIGAKSQRFTVELNDNNMFVVKGSGWGHNCGMSQYGAYSMAKHHGKSYEDIIKFYYTGVYIR